MNSELYGEQHQAFRAMYRDFLEREVLPNFSAWEHAGHVPRQLYRRIGELGIIGMAIPEEHGGGGVADFRFNAIINEEHGRAAIMLGSLRTHLDVVLPYFLEYCDEAQRARWFPRLATGDLFSAIAMTEPGTGSDLAGVRTAAVRDGDEYVVNGAKTFITGGFHAELFVTLVRTSTEDDRRAGLTLLVVEDGTPGFTKGRLLEKIGLKAQDTVELAFDDARVPVANRLGEEGLAFSYLGRNLPQERLTIAVGALAAARAALELTVEYVKERKAFGTPVASFQNTKFELAAVATEVEAGQALVDRAVMRLVDGDLSGVDAAKVKLFCTELQSRAVDRCLQLFGGYGYIRELPIARLYEDARVTRIYGGTSEVMKSIISRSLGLR
jgi:acyl-CoA dehydrogenase